MVAQKMATGILPSLCLLIITLSSCTAYYIPGTYPKEFLNGDNLSVEVNSLSSFDTELPYEYYSMPFCQPEAGIKKSTSSVNPGTILSGLRMFNSPYAFTMQKEEISKLACGSKNSYGPLKLPEVRNLKHKIRNHYRIRMVLDNIPVTNYDLSKGPSHLRPGFELGYMAQDEKDTKKTHYYIFNHLVFNVLIHKTHGEYTQSQALGAALALEDSGRRLLGWPAGTPPQVVEALKAQSSRTLSADEEPAPELQPAGAGEEPVREMWMVVGFEVMPCSIKRDATADVQHVRCKPVGMDDNPPPAQEIMEGEDIVYTYDVYFDESPIVWASRWDAYLRMPGGRVHWFSIMNSVLVVLVMSIICAVILMRTVRRDLAKYEELLVEGHETKEESGWKLVSGDAFRCPSDPQSFAVQVGSGTQILCTGLVTMCLAAVGFLSPAARGALLTTAIVLYLLLAVTAGYAAVFTWGLSQRSYTGWTAICLKTACYFPGITMAVLTVMNIVIRSTGTSGAIPFTMYFSLVAIWFVVSIPLTYVGGFMAFKTPLIEFPTRTNQIPRHIPTPPAAANPYLLYLAAGVLPFCTVFIELYFAMTSMWQGYFYYLFGFLSIVVVLTIIITVEVAILCTYVQLCAEDYLWWWRSFHRGGSIAIYLMLYAFVFLFNTLTAMHGMSVLLYLSYMLVVVLAVHLSMGAIGFASSFYFVYRIFAAVKAD